MKIISLKCNSCAADLQVNENTKFFNCSFCNSSLALKKSGNAVYSEVLGEIKDNTEAILDTSEKLLLEKQLARLDREWEQQSETYKDYENIEKEGSEYGPIIGAIVFFFFAMIMGIMMMNQHQSMKSSSPFRNLGRGNSSSFDSVSNIMIVFFIILFCLIVFTAISSTSEKKDKKQTYKTLKGEYEEKRQALLNKIESTD